MGNDNDGVIKVEDLSFAVNQSPILKRINLNIEKNETVGIIGPNGCGKSTLLKNIYRQYKPTNGIIFIEGNNIKGLKNRDMARKLAVVSQENNMEFDFNVSEVVALGRYSHGSILKRLSSEDEKITIDALKKVGMEKFYDRSFLSLSGGEKQRVYIAMAFAQQSRIIVMDEPTNHLDIGYQMLIMDMLHNMKDVTLLMSVHDFNLAAWFCNRIIVLAKGELIAEGKPEEILTKELIRSVFHVDSDIVIRESDGRMQVNFLGYYSENAAGY